MKRKKILLIFLTFIFLSCGIPEYLYIPQLMTSYIELSDTTAATIILPSSGSSSINDLSYALGYLIYYRIYISDIDITSTIYQSDMSRISQTLLNDYNSLRNYSDPSIHTSVLGTTTFRNMNYYELEIENQSLGRLLEKSSDNKIIYIYFDNFPGVHPFLSLDNIQYRLLRSKGGGGFQNEFTPLPENRFFFSSNDLNSYQNYNSATGTNLDVSVRSGVSSHAYTSMYIVAFGTDESFTRVFSKPTHIGVFKLPNDF